jgi:hypothetical protein
LFYPERHGRGALTVEVNEKHIPTATRKTGSDIDRSRGFSNAAFVVDNGYNLEHDGFQALLEMSNIERQN